MSPLYQRHPAAGHGALKILEAAAHKVIENHNFAHRALRHQIGDV
jgi:hypothetical protein